MRRIIVLILMSAVIQTVSALGWHNINVDLKTITAMGTAYGVEGAEEGNTATALDSIFQHYKSGGIAMAGIFVSKKNDKVHHRCGKVSKISGECALLGALPAQNNFKC